MRVHINYEVLEKNGTEYLNFSKELNDIITNLKNECANIEKNWISSNAPIYISQMNDFINTIQIDANRMERHGNVILGIKDDFREKDLEYAKKNMNIIAELEGKTYDHK